MAFIRPIVYVYQQFDNVVVAPGAPDLNCCIVGPAYNIMDYSEDKTDIVLADFIKAGETANAPCKASGTSFGRPDPGTDFVTISDTSRPEHIAGAVLDEDSVQVYFDDLYIEVAYGEDGALADGDYEFEDTVAGDFSGYDADGTAVNASGTQKIAAGDRIVLTKTPGGDGALTDVKTVAYVVSATKLALTSTKKTDYVTWPNENFGNTIIRWRVEHKLDDQLLDDAYFSMSSGDLTITTGATGILMAYQSLTWSVNYSKMYYGYRELRTDLDDVLTINSIDDVTSDETLIGRIDERNPLAAAVQVALANTGNSIQVFGVSTDDLTGHQSARDRMTSRSDIYAIVPVTDAVAGVNWVIIINMWKAHCVAYAAYDVAKFRIVIGSYDTLPTEKASAPASLVGHSVLDAAEVIASDFGVFVDPASATNFITDQITSSHLLDIMHGDANLTTLTATKPYIFDADYTGPRELRGVMGGKRLRTTLADAPAAAVAANANCYAVRSPILKGEGATPLVDKTACAWATNADPGTAHARITKTGAFADVLPGDVVHVTAFTTTAAHEDGWVVITTFGGDSDNYIDIECAEVTGDTVEIQIYRPIDAAILSTITALTRTFTSSGGTDFANVAIGDMVFAMQSDTSTNDGMWIVQNVIADDEIVVGDPATALTDSTVLTNFVVFRPVSSNADASITTRARLTRLRDDTATFTTSVEAAEDINIPYPVDTDTTKWDTPTTQWPIETVVNDNMLDAQLGVLEELAPDAFIAGYAGDMPYRISIDLNRDSQVTELNTITTSLSSSRCVMTWPNSLYVSNLENELTSTQNKQSGQYLACAVGGMIAGLPSHQGFTYIGIGGIQQLFNSNFYFTEDQLTDLRNGGWYVFKQDSSASLPYTIHEVTTDVSAYEFGELMNVKNFDYVSLYMKEVLDSFLGKYNITTETLEMIKTSLNAAASFLQLRIFPKIGVPLLSANITYIAQLETEVDRVEVYMDVTLPKVLNRIGLHLVAG